MTNELIVDFRNLHSWPEVQSLRKRIATQEDVIRMVQDGIRDHFSWAEIEEIHFALKDGESISTDDMLELIAVNGRFCTDNLVVPQKLIVRFVSESDLTAAMLLL